MPEYVTVDGFVFKVSEYDGEEVWFETNSKYAGSKLAAQVFPATKEEYESFINSKTQNHVK